MFQVKETERAEGNGTFWPRTLYQTVELYTSWIKRDSLDVRGLLSCFSLPEASE